MLDVVFSSPVLVCPFVTSVGWTLSIIFSVLQDVAFKFRSSYVVDIILVLIVALSSIFELY